MIRYPRQVLALGLIVSGLSLLTAIVLPIGLSTVRFRFLSSPQLLDPTAVGPFPRPRIINVLGITTVDYSQPQVWFIAPSPPSPDPPPLSKVRYYTLSIPDIGLTDIPVEINGPDLKKNAVHYPGTALPGQVGNSVVLGHSALPGLYRPDNPLVIFNSLPKIKTGAEVIVRYDGLTYRYIVNDTREVRPDQVEVLAPTPNRRQITLITCVPLGTYWRRFVARADLVN